MVLALKADILNNAPKSHIAGTQLNICAILSELGRHLSAIEYAKVAIEHLESTRADLSDPTRAGLYSNINQQSLLSTIAIAYFNLGAEYEHVNNLEAALESQKKAIQLAEESKNVTLQSLASHAKEDIEIRLRNIQEKLERRSHMRSGAKIVFSDSSHNTGDKHQMKRRRRLMRSQNHKYFGPYMRFSFEGTERDLSQLSKRKEGPSLRGSMLSSRVEELKGAG